MTNGTSLGFVVVGFNSEDLWPGFFAALDSSSVKPAQVVVVENSAEAPKNLPTSESYEITSLHLHHNPGYGSAANAGVKELPDAITHVVIANADTLVERDTIERLLSAQHDFPQTGVLGPAVVTQAGTIYPSARAIPGVRIGIGHALFGTLWPSNPWTQRYLGDYLSSESRPAGWVSGSFILVNREAFTSVDGFDESYFMFFEDVDLCFRLKQNGWRSVYVPRASITHIGGHSTAHNMAEMVAAHHDSARRFLNKLYPRAWHAPLKFALFLGLGLRSAIVSRLYRQRSRV